MSVSLFISCWWCSREDLSRTWHREVTQKPSNNHNIRLHLTNPNPLIFSIHKNKKFILHKSWFILMPTIPKKCVFLSQIARFPPSEACKEKAHRGHRWANKTVIKNYGLETVAEGKLGVAVRFVVSCLSYTLYTHSGRFTKPFSATFFNHATKLPIKNDARKTQKGALDSCRIPSILAWEQQCLISNSLPP